MLERNYRDIVAGVALAVFGGAAATYGLANYSMGTITRMGPGMMPVSLGIILAAFGVAIAVPAWKQPGEAVDFRYRPMLMLSAAVLAFALMIDRFGLAPSVFATTFIATLAETRVSTLRALALSAAVTTLTWAIFIAGLRLSVPAVDWPF